MSAGLAPALAAAVHLEMLRLREMDPDTRRMVVGMLTGPHAADLVGTYGDVLLYGGPQCTQTFQDFAARVACAAFHPGGISLFDMHFCADHELCTAAEAELGAAS